MCDYCSNGCQFTCDCPCHRENNVPECCDCEWASNPVEGCLCDCHHDDGDYSIYDEDYYCGEREVDSDPYDYDVPQW